MASTPPANPTPLPVPAVKFAASGKDSQLYAVMVEISERLKKNKEDKNNPSSPSAPSPSSGSSQFSTSSASAPAVDSCGLTVGLKRPFREDEIKHSKSKLFVRLAGLKLKEHVMNDDGNCMFSAVSHQIFGTPDHYDYVRQCSVKQLRKQPGLYQILFGSEEEFRSYITSLERSGSWGDEITLKALCDHFAFVAHIIVSTPGNWLLRYSPSVCTSDKDIGFMYKRRQIYLSYLAPVHYNSITYEDGSFIMLLPGEGVNLPELQSAV